MLWKQQVVSLAAIALGVGYAAQVFAQEPAASRFQANTPEPGFYGGIALRENAQDTGGISLGRLNSAWGKFVAPTADESGSRALVFGGYRWRNDIALEAAFGTAESYALTPRGPRGVGLSLAGISESATGRTWNADVYTSWTFRPSFALYGRLGYIQSDASAGFVSALPSIDNRRTRDGVNYGVGLRYDVTPALGLRLEYARFGRFAGENIAGFLPESDQVQFGMQFRF
ncbi:MAG TPA: outer membrane beta-barrel protein [Casimicrobiaceae bacterium]|jgi:opacity protein-like surface antigen